jgi:hypothetical protein
MEFMNHQSLKLIYFDLDEQKKNESPTNFDKFFKNICAKSLIVRPLRKSSMFFFFLGEMMTHMASRNIGACEESQKW